MSEQDVFPDLKTLRLVPTSGKLQKVTDGTRNWFVKNLDPAAAAMTMRASEASTQLGPEAITQIARAKKIEWDDLPEALKQKVHGGYGREMFLIEEVPASPGIYQLGIEGHEPDRPEAFARGLRNQPMSKDEQRQLIAEWEKLAEMGIRHWDLASNMGFSRQADGKLKIGVWDFDDHEVEDDRSDVECLKEFLQDMQKAGTAESLTSWAQPGLKSKGADPGTKGQGPRKR
jgi:hypothetical protein